jgi:hypothetical protein
MTSSARHTPADIFQTIAWAALTAVLFGYAIADGTIGALVLGALTLVQTWRAWTVSSEAVAEAKHERFAPHSLA